MLHETLITLVGIATHIGNADNMEFEESKSRVIIHNSIRLDGIIVPSKCFSRPSKKGLYT